MEKLLSYINGLSKADRLAFADACLTSEGYLRKAVSRKQLLGTAICVAIERESRGAVCRKDLRPEDWRDNWPELIGATTKETTT